MTRPRWRPSPCCCVALVFAGRCPADPPATPSPALPGPDVVHRRIVHPGVCLLWRCSSSGTTHQCRASVSAASTASAACSSERLGCSAWAGAPCPSSWRYVELLSREPIRRLGCQVSYAQQCRCHAGSRNLPYSRYSTTCRRRVSSPWSPFPLLRCVQAPSFYNVALTGLVSAATGSQEFLLCQPDRKSVV